MGSEIIIPEKLYGRNKELRTVYKSFERISKGAGEVLTVPGISGVGKTALVKALEPPVKDENGFFETGKFEQYNQNIPYFAFRQALAGLCQRLLDEDEEILSRYKSEILDAIGTNGRILTNLVPEIELIIGRQPPAGEISPQEARHRFTEVFRSFLKVICRPEHPLILFIDDWQWADAASLELLKQMQIGKELRYILVIVAYRDNEVNASHPLSATLEELPRNNIQVNQLKVKNLSKQQIREILHDTLQPNARNLEELATLINKKTEGNPFFIRSVIQYMSEFDLIWFDKDENAWNWKTDPNTGDDIPDDSVELFVRKLKRMNKSVQKLLSLASCVGNRFFTDTLATISEFSVEDCRTILESSKASEFVAPLNPLQAIDKSTPENNEPEVYIFRHDRLQQAAFSPIPEDQLPAILFRIGKLLLTKLSEKQLEERFFEVVGNLNAGTEFVDDHEELVTLFFLNAKAAQKAYNATAYSASLQYYRTAGNLLTRNNLSAFMWKNHHEQMYDYLKQRAVNEFLQGDHAIAEKCIQEAVENSKKAVEKADAYNILIVQYTLQARYPEAISTGKTALKTLGIDLPEDGYDEARDKEIAKVREQLRGKKINSLAKLPVMTNPEKLMAAKILITMGPPCYRSHQKLWSVMVPVVVQLTLRYGNIPQVGYSHTAFGGLLGWVDDDFETARDFAELATRLMTQHFNIPSEQSVFYLMIGSSIRHWFKHLKYSSQDYTDAYEIGLRSGNLQYAAYAFGHNMYCRFYQSLPLEPLKQETKRSLEFSKTRHNQWAIDLFTGGMKILEALSSGDTHLLTEKNGDSEYLQNVDSHSNIQVKCIYNIMKTFSLLIMKRYEDALNVSDETEPIIFTVGTQGLLPWAEHVFARSLILTALYTKQTKDIKQQWLEELKQLREKLRIWAKFGSANFEHKFLLATAEIEKIENNPKNALRHYFLAADSAREGNFLQWEGLAYERIYHFWLEEKNDHLAFHYWKQAYICYEQWGAVSKLRAMEEDYSKYLQNSISRFSFENINDETNDPEFGKWLIRKQLNEVKKLAFHLHESKLRSEAMNQAEELASATKRLRSEISFRKEAEEEVKRKNSELEKINAEKDKFFSIITHDLKGPFSSIQGFSELLLQKVRGNDITGTEEFAKLIHLSSHRAMELLMNLLEWSRSQTGRMNFNPTTFDLLEIITETELLLTDIAQQKGIRINKKLPQKIPVTADKSMLSTVLRNLISNAIKFTHPNGKIEIDVERNQTNTVVKIKDSGVGISKEKQKKLFRVGENITTRGTQNEKGTGLGLVLCKEFIEKHEGDIGVSSEPGQGATFFFFIPNLLHLKNK